MHAYILVAVGCRTWQRGTHFVVACQAAPDLSVCCILATSACMFLNISMRLYGDAQQSYKGLHIVLLHSGACRVYIPLQYVS